MARISRGCDGGGFGKNFARKSRAARGSLRGRKGSGTGCKETPGRQAQKVPIRMVGLRHRLEVPRLPDARARGDGADTDHSGDIGEGPGDGASLRHCQCVSKRKDA